MYQFNFEKLEVWQMSRKMTNLIYDLTLKFPDDEKFNLTSQVKRAAVSVMNNLAEGAGRMGGADQARFYSYSYGSLMEVLNCSILANDRDFISEVELAHLRELIAVLSKKIINLRKAQLK